MRTKLSANHPYQSLGLEMTTEELASLIAFHTSNSENEQWTHGYALDRQLKYALNDVPESKVPTEIRVIVVPKTVKNSP